MGLKTFTYNGVNSGSLGLYVLGSNSYDSAKRLVDKYHIPGKNGDIIVDSGSYANITIAYDVALRPLGGNLEAQIEKIKEALMSYTVVTYNKLTDSYITDGWRMAAFVGPIEWDTMLNKYGKTTLYFDCKPQLYHTADASFDTTFDTGTSNDWATPINNPYGQVALPIIEVWGQKPTRISMNANLSSVSSGYFLDFSNISGSSIYPDFAYIIDCENRTIKRKELNTSVTDVIVGQSGNFPNISPLGSVLHVKKDSTAITTPTSTYIKVTPNFWTL